MRGLSPTFLAALKTGFLADLRARVIADKDLDLQIRKGYVNIYYKGNALLKLTERLMAPYRVEIDEKVLGELTLPDISDAATAQRFLDAIPYLKERIIIHGKSSLEVEYEQLLIRANNLETRNNSEYFIVDRQYARGQARFDLIGVCWPRNKRRANQEIAPCFFEIKYALNSDIQHLHEQLQGYYDLIASDPAGIAQEIEQLFRQKLELELLRVTPEQQAAMRTLTVARDIARFQFIVVLVDYNPFSTLLQSAEIGLATLPFASQVRMLHAGFALWQQSLQPVTRTAP